jgi:hypothetical protein
VKPFFPIYLDIKPKPQEEEPISPTKKKEIPEVGED